MSLPTIVGSYSGHLLAVPSYARDDYSIFEWLDPEWTRVYGVEIGDIVWAQLLPKNTNGQGGSAGSVPFTWDGRRWMTDEKYDSSSTSSQQQNSAASLQRIQGPQGPAGPRGPEGIQGPRGKRGEVGPTGPSLLVSGPTGPKGDVGDRGVTGPTGPAGIQGAPGIQGIQGEDGDLGPTGPMGATGMQGEQGIQGETGDLGPTGPQGPTGAGGSSSMDYFLASTRRHDNPAHWYTTWEIVRDTTLYKEASSGTSITRADGTDDAFTEITLAAGGVYAIDAHVSYRIISTLANSNLYVTINTTPVPMVKNFKLINATAEDGGDVSMHYIQDTSGGAVTLKMRFSTSSNMGFLHRDPSNSEYTSVTGIRILKIA